MKTTTDLICGAVELTTGMQYGIYDTFRRYSLCLMYINRNTPSII